MPKALALVAALVLGVQWIGPIIVEPLVSVVDPVLAMESAPSRLDPVLVPETSSLSEQLSAAQQLQSVGEYEQAIQAYQKLIRAAPADSNERATAQFLLGQTFYQASQHANTVKALGEFITAYPTDPRHGQAIFLRGRAYQALSSWSEAIAQYQTYLTLDQTVASFVLELMGDCYLAASDFTAAVDVYQRALQGPIDQPMKLHLLEAIIDAQNKSAKFSAAAATADAMLQESQDGAIRAKAEYLAGQSLAAAGKTADSLARYRRAIDDYPKAKHAYLSLIELVNAEQAVDELKRGKIDYYGGAYTPAVRALDRFLKAEPAEHGDEGHYFLGLAYQALAQYALAIPHYDYIIEHYPSSASLGDAWIEKGRALAGSGKIPEAIEIWAQFVQLHPADALAPAALWLSGATLEDAGKFKEAAAAYASLPARYPQSDRAPAALHQAGLCALRAHQNDSALEAWRTLSVGYPSSPLRPAALFWLARLYHGQGNDDQATTAMKEIKTQYPNDYYAVRADEFQENWQTKLFQRSAQKSILLSPPNAAEQSEAEQWLLSWQPDTAKPAAGQSVSALSEALVKDGRLQRGVLLWQLDLTDDASAQLRGLKASYNDSPLELYRLGLYLNDRGLYRPAISCLDRVISLAPVERQAAVPTFLLKLTHPLHFSDLIVAEALERNLDPLLVLGMVRQESAFEAGVSSWVGARGLMQVMPATGDWIALQLAAKDYTSSALNRPYLNVRFGVWYMARQITTFDGDVAAALAAYNAGPGRLLQWQTPEMAQDDDLFLEYMPLSEPVSYVRRIYTHYSIYRKLYASQ